MGLIETSDLRSCNRRDTPRLLHAAFIKGWSNHCQLRSSALTYHSSPALSASPSTLANAAGRITD